MQPFPIASGLSAPLLSALALAALLAAPAQADVPSPEETVREAKVAHWRQAYPGTAPAMEASLSPDGRAMLLRIKAGAPASYTVFIDGKEAAKGQFAELKGGVRTERIVLAGHPGQDVRTVHVDYRLRGVARLEEGLRETGEEIAGCLRARYGVAQSGGKPVLKSLGLSEEDADILRLCGI